MPHTHFNKILYSYLFYSIYDDSDVSLEWREKYTLHLIHSLRKMHNNILNHFLSQCLIKILTENQTKHIFICRNLRFGSTYYVWYSYYLTPNFCYWKQCQHDDYPFNVRNAWYWHDIQAFRALKNTNIDFYRLFSIISYFNKSIVDA